MTKRVLYTPQLWLKIGILERDITRHFIHKDLMTKTRLEMLPVIADNIEFLLTEQLENEVEEFKNELGKT